jgi:hypothetical protein
VSDNPSTVIVKGGIFSNAAAVAVESVKSPLSSSSLVNTVRAYTADHAARTKPPTKPTINKAKTIIVNPTFKLVFLTVVAITIASGLAEVILASAWTVPTPNQQSAFDAMGFGWKAGLGAIFGLLGGKVT